MILSLALLDLAQAATLTVGNGAAANYSKVMDAYTAAADGDVIQIITAKAYRENYNFNNGNPAGVKRVTVRNGSGGTVTFDRPAANTTAAVVVVADRANITLEGIEFTRANDVSSPCASVRANSRLTLTNVTFRRCTTGSQGAAINLESTGTIVGTGVSFLDASFFPAGNPTTAGAHVYSAGNLTLTDSTFAGETAAQGGSLFVAGGTTTLTRVTFTGGTATGAGGAIGMSGGSLFTNALVIRGATAVSGAAISITGGAWDDVDGWIDQNTATGAGGGVHVSGGAALTLQGTRFSDNHAGADGGGVYGTGSGVLDWWDVDFSNNSAVNGGHAAITNASRLDVQTLTNGSVFENGTASAAGGGLWLSGTPAQMHGAAFANNVATGNGGALFATDLPTSAISQCALSDNRATEGAGAAIAARAAAAIGLTDVSFTENLATTNGGALRLSGSGAWTLLRTRLLGNEARAGDGGAIWAQTAGTLTLRFSDLLGNIATRASSASRGGGVWALSTNVTARYSRFEGNRALITNLTGNSGGSAVYVTQGALDVAQCAVLGNVATGSSPFALDHAQGAITVRNNVLIANGSGVRTATPTSTNVGYNLFFNHTTPYSPSLSSAAAIVADPLLAWSNDGDYDNDDFVPPWQSPVIDAGDPALLDPDGSRSDIGLYGGSDADDWDPSLWDDLDGDTFAAIADCDDLDARARRDRTWWPDSDGDSFGDGNEAGQRCLYLDPSDVLNDDDCDDGDAAENPNATWYIDRDGDSFGDATATGRACERANPTDVSNRTDCVDDPAADAPPRRIAADIYPGALIFTDLDADGYGGALVTGCTWTAQTTLVGDDCDDGDITENPLVTWYPDSDGDGFGADDRSGRACERGAVNDVTSNTDCDDRDEDENPTARWYPDADRDGFGDERAAGRLCERNSSSDVLDRADCDDADATEKPGARWYPDADRDGFGDPTATPAECARDANSDVADFTDCDDNDATEKPGATWFPDRDADGEGDASALARACDRATPTDVGNARDCDDADATETSAARWWPDADGDRFGDAAASPAVCARTHPSDADNNQDCDDNPADDTPGRRAADVFPGATYWRDQDGDTFGDAALTPEVCNLPAGYVTRAGDCDDDASDDTPARIAARIFPGAVRYTDVDGDGHGDPTTGVAAEDCELPAGTSTSGDDCLDDPSHDTVRVVAARVFPGATYYVDTDGDGWGDPARPATPETCGLPASSSVDPGDCDDGDADEHPNARWWPDGDGDGFGDDAAAPRACDRDAPTDVGRPGDCDDDPSRDTDLHQASASFPGATYYLDADGDGDPGTPDADSVCDAGRPTAASDCDDDDDDENLAARWYPDADGDGWGDRDATPRVCARGAATDVGRPGDCADGDPAIRPDAAERPGDRVDEDCDDLIWCWVDGDVDGFGVSTPVLDLDLDGACDSPGEATRDDDCDDGADATYPGAPEAQGDGVDSDCSCASDLPGDFGFGCGGPGDDDDGDGLSWTDELSLGTSDATPDSDGDGLRDDVERTLGTHPRLTDSDADGVDDLTEVVDANSPRDTDGDRTIDALDVDDDDDGTPTHLEPGNTDACVAFPGVAPYTCDDVPDAYDVDDDGDGRLSRDEAADTDGDGTPDAYAWDDDGDGAPTAWEVVAGTDPLDPDTDGDGVPDGVEWGVDPAAPAWDAPRNSDGDRRIDARDDDDDDDGISTLIEGTLDVDCGVPVGDGVPAYLDLDSDGDGLPDGPQDSIVSDNDGDGIADYLDCEATGCLGDADCDGLSNCDERDAGANSVSDDSDLDGVPDDLEWGTGVAPVDTDGDTIPDLLDPDDDGDGVPTAEELDVRCGARAADPPTDLSSCDGIPARSWGSGWTCDRGQPEPRNSDPPEAMPTPRAPDAVPDWLDADDDGDGVPTRDERDRDGDGAADDVDGDGTPNAWDADDQDGPSGDRDGDSLSNATERELGINPDDSDTDGDGYADGVEVALGTLPNDGDDDGDGLPTRDEGEADPDGDGVPAWRDPDADGDGTEDADEAADVDCDGIPGFLDRWDADGPCADGEPDPSDTDDTATAAPPPAACGCRTDGASPGLGALVLVAALRRRRR